MKTTMKLLGVTHRVAIIAFTALITFTLASCDEGSPAHVHNWGEWAITATATCSTEGVETRVCALNAEHFETRPLKIDPDAHDYGDWDVTTPATETAEGEETRTCAHDAEHKETRSITALNHVHDWSDWVQTTAPTCIIMGVETRICTKDATHKETRAGAAALGHDFGTWTQTIPPTCYRAGVETAICNRDGKTYARDGEPINPDAHQWGEWKLTKAPTATAEGVETKSCILNPAHKVTRPVDALGSGGRVVTPPAHTHQWGAYTQTSAATCSAAGVETRTCTLDSSHKETRPVGAALGHDYDNWTQTSAPTCTAAGVETGTCTRDPAHTTTRAGAAIDPTAHDSGAWHTTLDPTCTAAGTRELRCTRDNAVINSDTIAALGHTANTETGLCTVCNALTYSLGDTGPGGGKIFYLTATGFTQYADAADTAGTTAHYLEAAPDNMPSTLAWASSGYTSTNIANTVDAIGAGKKNTALILAALGANAPAAKACNDYSNGGKTDWFLPSKDELNQLYVNRTSVGNMGTNIYWSSSQYSAFNLWVQNFSSGNQMDYGKGNTATVRAVRAF